MNIFYWKSAKKKKKKGVVLRQSLGQIRSNVVRKKVKKLALSAGFLIFLHRKYISKQEVVVVQTPEWKFKANILKNDKISRT